jgi:hypothetical protein
MRAVSRRTLKSQEHLPRLLRGQQTQLARGAGGGPTLRVRRTANGIELRLVRPADGRGDITDRATVLRLAAGFCGIAGFVALGLWVEFGDLSKAAYLLAALLCFSLYGAVTLRPEPWRRQRGAATGRRS